MVDLNIKTQNKLMDVINKLTKVQSHDIHDMYFDKTCQHTDIRANWINDDKIDQGFVYTKELSKNMPDFIKQFNDYLIKCSNVLNTWNINQFMDYFSWLNQQSTNCIFHIWLGNIVAGVSDANNRTSFDVAIPLNELLDTDKQEIIKKLKLNLASRPELLKKLNQGACDFCKLAVKPNELNYNTWSTSQGALTYDVISKKYILSIYDGADGWDDIKPVCCPICKRELKSATA